ncbi:MAG TPA: hypothetical protein VFS00_06065, partial [Polyangiaceae bacterium]|nr:hypothetical protein [Polyangiaceae bacterium]
SSMTLMTLALRIVFAFGSLAGTWGGGTMGTNQPIAMAVPSLASWRPSPAFAETVNDVRGPNADCP